jgi:hypothetical protein
MNLYPGSAAREEPIMGPFELAPSSQSQSVQGSPREEFKSSNHDGGP